MYRQIVGIHALLARKMLTIESEPGLIFLLKDSNLGDLSSQNEEC